MEDLEVLHGDGGPYFTLRCFYLSMLETRCRVRLVFLGAERPLRVQLQGAHRPPSIARPSVANSQHVRYRFDAGQRHHFSQIIDPSRCETASLMFFEQTKER